MDDQEIQNLKNKIAQLQQENHFLKAGVDYIFEIISSNYPGLKKSENHADNLKYLGLIFSSLESSNVSMDQHLQALDSVSDGIAIFTKRGKMLFSNRSFLKIFEVNKKQTVDLHWRDIFSGANLLAVESFLREVNFAYPVHQEVVLINDRGKKFLNCAVYPLEDGKLLVNVKDITTDKKKF